MLGDDAVGLTRVDLTRVAGVGTVGKSPVALLLGVGFTEEGAPGDSELLLAGHAGSLLRSEGRRRRSKGDSGLVLFHDL